MLILLESFVITSVGNSTEGPRFTVLDKACGVLANFGPEVEYYHPTHVSHIILFIQLCRPTTK